MGWVMAGFIEDEIQTWRGIYSFKCYLNSHPPDYLMGYMEETNRRIFKGIEVTFGRLKDLQLQTLDFLVKEPFSFFFQGYWGAY